MAKKLRWAAAVLILLSAAALVFVQCWSWPLIGPNDTVEVYLIERGGAGTGADFEDVPLTEETKGAVEALLRGQRCRGVILDPYPLAVAAVDWEIIFRVNDGPGQHVVYGVQNFTYSGASAGGPFYAHLSKGKDTAAALDALFA